MLRWLSQLYRAYYAGQMIPREALAECNDWLECYSASADDFAYSMGLALRRFIQGLD